MQFDIAKRAASSSSFGLKRSIMQETAPESSSKVPRYDKPHSSDSSSFSFSRRSTPGGRPSFVSPVFEVPPSSRNAPARSKRGSFALSKPHSLSASGSARKTRPRIPVLDTPLRDEAYVQTQNISPLPIKPSSIEEPKSTLYNFSSLRHIPPPVSSFVEGTVEDRKVYRTTVTVSIEPPVTGIADHPDKRQSEKLAMLSAVYQLHSSALLDKKSSPSVPEITLSDSTVITYEQARGFMDYYCRRFAFGAPIIESQSTKGGRWEAVMTVGGRRIGVGTSTNKKNATIQCYLDVTQYLESCDRELWKAYMAASKTGADLGMAPKVFFKISDRLDDEIRDLCVDIQNSSLYKKRPSAAFAKGDVAHMPVTPSNARIGVHKPNSSLLAQRSQELLARHHKYLNDATTSTMRAIRHALPVYTRAEDVLSHIHHNEVTICMAATGSGKTTQIPQLILDSYIARGEGAQCNIFCTQPRRLAAISVAHRVAKERGEGLGKTVGYQVRFETNLPEAHGSITFCTTGIFLKRLQSYLSDDHRRPDGGLDLDCVSHIVVDEVHERDVDTDLLLVVLKKLMADRKARNLPLKIILMSATIDPTLFQSYFPDDNNKPAKVIEVPGRSFPVAKYFVDDFLSELSKGPAAWVLREEAVQKYISSELAHATRLASEPRGSKRDDDLDLPVPLVTATIAHVLQRSDSGHVLVFLPGWDDIANVNKALLTPKGQLGINFNDDKYSIHLLHSTIPLAEQQVIFEPPRPGVRRIILATNIAETSVTIPDVVYVVDSAKLKEQQYDPERHMSSLVSAWVGSSNLNQRAGRAGRHRSGEYFGLLSRAHAESLHPHQTVEMKRVDLTNVVMHVKALNFPGITVEEVLAAAIEPPPLERVAAAMKDLQMVGALDTDKNLTSLGRVLLEIPIDVQMGRLVLFGSFFRCLDQALTLAAILTNRDAFVAPMLLKKESWAKKSLWTPRDFKSDALASLAAYNEWTKLQASSPSAASRFCVENFLSRPTLLMISKIRGHILQSLYRTGVIDVSAGGELQRSEPGRMTTPPELNVNGNSLPLLAGLICIASQPKFAVRTSERTFRTPQDKMAFIHSGSVNALKKQGETTDPRSIYEERQLFAFMEKRQNLSTGSSSAPQTNLVTTTRIDPMTYMLFGAHKLEVTDRGVDCDGWLPIVGNLDALDDLKRLKAMMDACMLRVFEGILMNRRKRHSHGLPILPREESEFDDDDDARDLSMTREETKELDLLTRDVVRILNKYNEERMAGQSRQSSRPATQTSIRDTLSFLRSGHSTPGRSTTPLRRF